MSSQWDELLKRCPFCGRRAELRGEWGECQERYFVFVQCKLCKSRGSIFVIDPKTDNRSTIEEEAIEAWNTRAVK